jgi:hypothetical protein
VSLTVREMGSSMPCYTIHSSRLRVHKWLTLRIDIDLVAVEADFRASIGLTSVVVGPRTIASKAYVLYFHQSRFAIACHRLQSVIFGIGFSAVILLLLLLLLRRVGPDGSKAREDMEAHETPDSRLYRVSSSGPLPFERCASYTERIAHETDTIAIYLAKGSSEQQQQQQQQPNKPTIWSSNQSMNA